MELVSTPLLPEGYKVPASRNESTSKRLRRLLAEKPYVFAPGVYDPMGAQLVMHHGFDAVYFSGYSFALGHQDFIIIARTDGVSASEAPESKRGLELAIDRGLRYLDSGVPDLLWCEFPTAERGPTETFCTEIRKRFPKARFAFNYSSSF